VYEENKRINYLKIYWNDKQVLFENNLLKTDELISNPKQFKDANFARGNLDVVESNSVLSRTRRRHGLAGDAVPNVGGMSNS
jgi:hypothetical protein